MSILMICKLTRGYNYQVASREFPFAATYSEKKIDPINVLSTGINN